MPAAACPRRQPTDDWQQLRLLVSSSEQAAYELLRPIILFGQLPRERAHETGVPERTLQRRAARFAAAGMRSLFEPDDPPAADQRTLPLGIRKAIVELTAEYSPLSLRGIAAAPAQPFLPDLAEVDWWPVQHLAPYPAWRRRQAGAQQERLLAPELGAATG